MERRGFFNASRMQSRRWRGTSFSREREKDKERCTSGVFLSVFFASAIAVNYYAYLLVESIFIVTGKFKLRFHFLYLEYRSSVAHITGLSRYRPPPFKYKNLVSSFRNEAAAFPSTFAEVFWEHFSRTGDKFILIRIDQIPGRESLLLLILSF